MRYVGSFFLYVAIAVAVVVAVLAMVLGTDGARGRELYPGQYAQVDPQIREWFRTRKSPSGKLCCSEADGTGVEEQIEGNHYKIRFAMPHGADMPGATPSNDGRKITPWITVPEEAVINEPAPIGPVAWYVLYYGTNGQVVNILIRCFVPGAKF
jgi:hypothetical protein